MKKIILLPIFLFLICLLEGAFAFNEEHTFSSSATISGTILQNGSPSIEHFEKIIFPNNDNGVKVNANNLDWNNAPTSNISLSISGNFWVKGFYVPNSPNSGTGWVTFDHGIDSAKASLVHSGDNKFTLKGFAWSPLVGWIYFGDELGSNNVLYDRNTGIFSGFGRNSIIGWIPFEGLNLDTKAPELPDNLKKAFAADNEKQMNFTSVTDFKQISIEKHDSPSYGIYSSTGFQHNFSKVKPLKDLKNGNYAYQLEDISGNVTKGYFRVVANVPDFTDYNFSRIIYTINNKIADGSDYHEVKLILEDKYQNPIIDVDGVKNMEVKIGFNDKVRTNQFENSSTYDAIVYTSSGFININQAKNGIATSTNDNGEYIVKLKSYAPTTTSSNDKIKLNSLTVNVTATGDNSGVGEIIGEQSIISASNYNFDFEPTHTIENIKLYNIGGIDGGITYHEINGSQEITVGYDYEFSGSIIEKGNATISNMKILNILDIENSESESFNDEIVFQNLTGGIFDSLNNRFRNSCNSYRKIGSVYHLEYFNSDYCSKFAGSGSSTIYLEFDDSTSNDNLSFYATPNILGEDIFSEGVVHYSSYISYQNGDKYVIYPSSISPQDINMTNRNIKIAGTINNKYIYDRVVIGEVLDTTLSKTEMRKNVVKNVNNVLKNKNNIPSNIKYSSGNLTLNSSLPSGIDTIIVEGGDLIINGDILKQDANKLNSIIVLKDSNGNGGNLWINKNVKFISAIIFVDGAIFSGNSEYYWSDTGEAVNQLFIKGSIISNNTIGGALLSNELKCPYVYEGNCDKQAAKRYDFYFFRHFNGMSEETKISSGVYGFDYVDMTKDGYSGALMIIEYDSKIKTNPPSWFLIK